MKRILDKWNCDRLIPFAQTLKRHNSTRPSSQGEEELREDAMHTLNAKATNKTIEESVYSLAGVINDLIIGEVNNRASFTAKQRTDRWKGTNLMLLPNIRNMKIETTGMYSALKEMFGISWKLRNIKLWGWRNRKHNKYLKAMYTRLQKARVKSDLMKDQLLKDADFRKLGRKAQPNLKYWNLAYFLMTHSLVFQTVHLNKVLSKERTWPGKAQWHTVISLMQEVNHKLRSGKWMEIEVRRVWIDNDKRPLGVPTLPDRIIGSMLNSLLEYYLWDTIKYNHGYQSRKGSGTAWQKILKHLIYYPHIWEYDLDGCFNRISHEALGNILRSLDLPSWLWISLVRMQKRAPIVTAASGGKVKVTRLGNRKAEVQEGASKKFLYWDAQAQMGVAQGHSLSPLLSVIVMEHAIRSWMSRKEMEGSSCIKYADDGIFFTLNEFPSQKFAAFIQRWGMHLSRPKCGVIRADWVWKKAIKFLGLIYDPFHEKLRAHTRKGSRVVLETARGYLLEDGKLLSVEEGIFYREGPYSKLGEWVPINGYKIDIEFRRMLVALLGVILHPWTMIFSILYLWNRGWIVWWYVMLIGGILSVFDLHGLEILLVYFGVLITGVGLPDFEIRYGEGWNQQITWRLVLKAGKLNTFIARLYNKQLADKIVPQDFKLRKEKGSLLWYLSNRYLVAENFEKYMESQGIWHHNWIDGSSYRESGEGDTLLEAIEKDLGTKVNFANSSTVGCYLLIEMLSRGEKAYESTKSPYGLYRSLLDKFQLNGYWWGAVMADSRTGQLQGDGVWRESPNKIGGKRLGRPLGKQLGDMQTNKKIIDHSGTIKLLKASDWVYQLTVSWFAVINQNRHRWYTMWPEHKAPTPICTGRVYKQYRVHTIMGTPSGWVPVIRKKWGTAPVKTPPMNHKYAMVVPQGGAAVHEFKPSLLFSRKKT